MPRIELTAGRFDRGLPFQSSKSEFPSAIGGIKRHENFTKTTFIEIFTSRRNNISRPLCDRPLVNFSLARNYFTSLV